MKNNRPKRRRSSWTEYEKLKSQLDPSLSHEEREKKIRKLASKLKI